jgi:protoheme IX farnesyltransferase
MKTTVSISSSSASASWKDYLELCKPKVVALMLLTSVVGMLLATYSLPSWEALILGNLGIALMAGSAAAINHVVDQRIDVHMARTKKRPIVQGKVDSASALIFAALIGSIGMLVLMVWVNALTAWLTLASLIGYALIYTMYLKRATPQNIVIGGLAGAAPPLLGWTASTGYLDPHALLLVLIIFAWTPPHFWALAIHRKEEYAQVGIPMLPVTHGESYTKLHILLYSVILLLVTILPYLTGMCGEIYLVSAVLLGLRFIQWSVRMIRNHHKHDAINTFKFSITYLMLLFVALLVDHYTWPMMVAM